MFVALRGARVNDKFQDSLYLFLELTRAGVMHGHLWSGRAFSGGPSFGTGKEIYPNLFPIYPSLSHVRSSAGMRVSESKPKSKFGITVLPSFSELTQLTNLGYR